VAKITKNKNKNTLLAKLRPPDLMRMFATGKFGKLGILIGHWTGILENGLKNLENSDFRQWKSACQFCDPSTFQPAS